MGAEVFLLGLIVFTSLGLGVGRSIMNRYLSDISFEVGSFTVNLEYAIIGAALIVVGYEILSFPKRKLISRR